MEFRIEMVTDVVICTPVGSLVASEAEEFRESVARLLGKKFGNILLDMSRIDFLDSSGLGAVIAASRQVAAAGGVFACSGLSDATRKLFRMTRADQKLAVAETRSDGLLLVQERIRQGGGQP